MRTTLRRRLLAGASLAGALFITLLAPVAAQGACSLTVSPKEGAPGTAFVFTGSGFTTTTLTFSQAGAQPRSIPVTDTSAPFTVRLIAGVGDVGRWRAVAEGCADRAVFQVSLPSTATAAAATIATTPGAPDRIPALAAFVVLAVLFLACTAVMLPRITRAPRAH